MLFWLLYTVHVEKTTIIFDSGHNESVQRKSLTPRCRWFCRGVSHLDGSISLLFGSAWDHTLDHSPFRVHVGRMYPSPLALQMEPGGVVVVAVGGGGGEGSTVHWCK